MMGMTTTAMMMMDQILSQFAGSGTVSSAAVAADLASAMGNVAVTVDTVNLTARISLILLVIALGFAFLRLVLGPSLPDRIIALDLVATLLVGLIAVSAIETGDVIFLRVAMVVALFNFIGTIGFCWYLQRGPQE